MLKIILTTALACAAIHQAALAQTIRWVQMNTAVSPAGRQDAAMVYDSAREEVVLVGGRNGAGQLKWLADKWTFKGNVWTLKKPNVHPPAMTGHAMAYDEARKEVVLFGGGTWTWDGRNWKQRSTSSGPNQQGYAMAYDATRQRTVLFGGSAAETWEWDGKTWTQAKPTASPPVRGGHAMVYDSVRKQILLFGGAGKTLLADTWSWDGKIWTQKKPTVSPPARAMHSMAFDSQLQAVILFGGYPGGKGAPRLSDTWMWDGKTWK